jgi:hypothetical protein
MSIFAINYICREIMRNPQFRTELRHDPETALSRYDLTAHERGALLSGDVGTLYRMGVNSFLMGYLPRYEMFGLDMKRYGERMRATTDQRGGH